MASEKANATIKSWGPQCFVINCYNYKNSKPEGVTFHKFPRQDRSPERRKLWIRECRRTDTSPTNYSLVCSVHFSEEQIDRTGQIVRLRCGAVPNLVTLPPHLQKKPKSVRYTATSQAALEPLPVAFDDPQHSVIKDHSYTLSDSPGKLKRVLKDKEEQLSAARKKLRNAEKRETYAKDKSSQYLEQLEELNLVNAELRLQLEAFGDIPAELFKKPANAYTKNQRDFAVTLHLYSPKAYEYLRNSIKLPLPNPRTLRRWLERVDGGPGLNLPMIQTLKQRKAETPDKYTNCCLMLDAMSIRQHVDYNRHNGDFIGYVNLGNDDDGDREAKETLVFLLVGLNARWKAPIAYFFTAGLGAETQAQLLIHCLNTLEENGFSVLALTLDGHATNVSMCKLLGADMDPLGTQKTWFSLANERKVYVFFDACHLLKLMRNTLQAYRVFYSADGRVSWQYISDLQKAQDESGLKLANKLTARHVDFHQQKMKVSLATQVLSSSTACALRTLKETDKRFIDCEATADFVQRMDMLFDILNSKSPVGRGYKCALSLNNIADRRMRLLEMKEYLLNLNMIDGLPLYKSRRGLCARGLVTDISSLLGLTEDLLPHQMFLSTYKLSQDHLELFFNAVRRSCGWNNNPTAKHFTSIFKKIISHCGALQLCASGNCRPLEATDVIQLATSTYCPPVTAESDALDPFCAEELAILDHPYSTSRLDSLVENAVVYIAGWVVRKLFRTLLCTSCRASLVTKTPSPEFSGCYTLLLLKQKGGLLMPSKSCITVLMSAEKHIRRLSNIQSVDRHLNLLRLQSSVIMDVSAQIFQEEAAHMKESQDGIDSHHYCLIRELVKVFYHLRQHHIANVHNIRRQGHSVRFNLNKITLFKGQ